MNNGEIAIVNGEVGIYKNGETLLTDGTKTKNPPDYVIKVVDEILDYSQNGFTFPELEVGDRGKFVEIMQVCLKYHGFKIKCDGDFGSDTFNALRDFRYDNYLSGDTVCDSFTWERLLNT